MPFNKLGTDSAVTAEHKASMHVLEYNVKLRLLLRHSANWWKVNKFSTDQYRCWL